MKIFILISLACLSSLMVACASTHEKSLLEERACYGFTAPTMQLGGKGAVKYVPTRIPERVIVPWLHAKELPSKDYFWGAWLSVSVAPESWEMKKIEVAKLEKKAVKRTASRPTSSPPKVKRP